MNNKNIIKIRCQSFVRQPASGEAGGGGGGGWRVCFINAHTG